MIVYLKIAEWLCLSHDIMLSNIGWSEHTQLLQFEVLASWAIFLYRAIMTERFTEFMSNPDKDQGEDGAEERGVATKVRPKTKKPSE